MKIFWIFLLSALFHMVLASGSLHSLVLRYHYGLDRLQIGNALFCSYLILAVAPFGVMWLKSHVRSIWAVYGGLLALQGVLLILFPLMQGLWLGAVIFAALIVLASMNGSLFRAASVQVLPIARRESLYIYLMFTAALAYGGVAFVNSFWVDGHLGLAYVLFGCLSIGTAVFAIWGGQTDPQKNSGYSRLSMSVFWRNRNLLSMMVLLCTAVMASNAGDMYMAFFLREVLGGRDSHVSLAWAVGVLTELPLYFLAIFWLKRYSPLSLLWVAFGGIALRMALLSCAPSIPIFLLAQSLDGFYSGVLFSVFPLYLAQFFNGRRLAFANLFAAVFYLGLGRALTGLCSSWIWEIWGLRVLFGFWSLALVLVMMLVAILARRREGLC